MTIPITPGPFSFLAEFGRAGGAGFAAAERERQQKIEEAYRAADLLLKLSAQRKDPSMLATPQAMAIYKDLGISPPSTLPTSEERVEDIKRRALAPQSTQGFNVPVPSVTTPGLITGSAQVQPSGMANIPLEQKIAAGLPLPSQVGREQIAPKVIGAEAARADLETTQATTALPEAAATVTAEQQSIQDKSLGGVADRVVQDLWIRLGRRRLPTVDEAWNAGKDDPRVKAYKGRLNQPYFGQAIERLRARLEAEETLRIRAYDSGPSSLDRNAAVKQRQIAVLENRLKNLSETMLIQRSDVAMHAAAMKATREGKTITPFVAEGANRYARYLQARQALMTDIDKLNRELLEVVTPAGQSTTEPGGAPGQSGRTLDDNAVSAAARHAVQTRATEAQILRGVTDNRFTQADADAIIAAYRRMRTHDRSQ